MDEVRGPANPLGAKDVTKGTRVDNYSLAPGRSVTFRYRVLILNGPTTREAIEEQYREWSR